MAEREKHPLIASLEQRRERHKLRSRVYRVMFAVAGATVTLAGLIMLVTPGPALVVVPIGLAMLALEFAWAEEMLERAVERAEAARRTATEASRLQKLFGALATAAAIAAGLAAAVVWDIPLLPV
ncbi:MAG: PGPGW domain-containing protein [Thermoleophilaceae bacterium]